MYNKQKLIRLKNTMSLAHRASGRAGGNNKQTAEDNGVFLRLTKPRFTACHLVTGTFDGKRDFFLRVPASRPRYCFSQDSL